MSDITCKQVYQVTPTEVNGVLVDYTGVLRQGEICTGSPTVSASGLTISSAAVTTAVQVINGASVEAGKAVSFTITGGTDGTNYAVKTSCGTSASRTREVYCLLQVVVPAYAAP